MVCLTRQDWLLLWSQVSGPGTVSFAVDTASNTTATFSEVGAYTLRITANDSAQSAFDEVTVTVTEPGTTGRVTAGLLALYPFDEGAGETVIDQSGVGAPPDLNIANPGNVTWGEGTLTINASTTITSGGAAAKLNSAIPASGAITVEAWVEPANATQSGPARIVSISLNGNSRNMTLGQGKNRKPGTHYDMRLRTTSTDNNGRPTLSTPANSLTTNLTNVVYTRDADGNAMFYLDGVPVNDKTVGGDMSNWNSEYALALANEQRGDRPWLGLFDLVAIYELALSPAQVLQNFNAGPGG